MKDGMQHLLDLFDSCRTPEMRYRQVIQLGRQLDPFPVEEETEENRVFGCQSTMYLLTTYKDGKIYLQAKADALISAGLAALFVIAYSGNSPQTILATPPDFLDEIQIRSSLSPNRANGLMQIHLKIKRDIIAQLARAACSVP